MKEIVRSITIDYRWWRGQGKKIKPEHVEALDEAAMNRIAEMMNQGYVSGELNDNIHILDTDPEDGVEYSGWWEVKKV